MAMEYSGWPAGIGGGPPTDSHWGFQGPAVNPDAQGALRKAVAEIDRAKADIEEFPIKA
jgi:hypothetical protein